MWYTILITLVVDLGGLVLVYLLLRDRLRRAASSEARVAEIREEVSRLLVELNQATDRNVALMEDRIGVLNEALSTADKKIGLLRRETEKHDVGSRIYSRLAEGRPPRPLEAEEAREAAPVPPAPAAPAPVVVPAPVAAPAPVAVPAPVAAPGSVTVPPLAVELSERASGDVHHRVMMLFRAGFSPSLIASRVGAPVGEVELIISLEQRKGQA
ncbi:MAG TPA: hypothetical protein VMF68_01575 [Spirochaetia bacterium]|nr:hypothetical protein [Spirochaetia bacterium]